MKDPHDSTWSFRRWIKILMYLLISIWTANRKLATRHLPTQDTHQFWENLSNEHIPRLDEIESPLRQVRPVQSLARFDSVNNNRKAVWDHQWFNIDLIAWTRLMHSCITKRNCPPLARWKIYGLKACNTSAPQGSTISNCHFGHWSPKYGDNMIRWLRRPLPNQLPALREGRMNQCFLSLSYI